MNMVLVVNGSIGGQSTGGAAPDSGLRQRVHQHRGVPALIDFKSFFPMERILTSRGSWFVESNHAYINQLS